MYHAIHSQGPGKVPNENTKSYIVSLYFILSVIIGSFFVTNLFVGIVTSTYNREKDRLGNNFMLSEE